MLLRILESFLMSHEFCYDMTIFIINDFSTVCIARRIQITSVNFFHIFFRQLNYPLLRLIKIP